MLFVVFVTSFLIITKQCRSQQCVSTNFKLVFKNTISSADYRPLLVIQDTNYGITFHKCLHLCSQSKQCIGFFLCKEKENLFVCQTCCEWKKIEGYTLGNSPNCKYIEKVTLNVYYHYTFKETDLFKILKNENRYLTEKKNQADNVNH